MREEAYYQWSANINRSGAPASRAGVGDARAEGIMGWGALIFGLAPPPASTTNTFSLDWAGRALSATLGLRVAPAFCSGGPLGVVFISFSNFTFICIYSRGS